MENLFVTLKKNGGRYVFINKQKNIFYFEKKIIYYFEFFFYLDQNFLYECLIDHKLVFGVYLNNVLEK